MKRNILFIISLFLSFSIFGQEYLYIYKTSNSIQEISVDGIDNIFLENNNTALNVIKTDSSQIIIPISNIDSITFYNPFSITHTKNNNIIDIFDNAGVVDWIFAGAKTHTGLFSLQNGVTIVSAGNNKFGKGYSFKKDTPFLQYNSNDGYQRIFQFYNANDLTGTNVGRYSVGFWIDRKQLQGLPFQFTSHGGGTWEISQKNLTKKGYITYQKNVGSKGFDQVEVTEVDGDFTHITIRSDKSKSDNPQLFNIIIENNSVGLKELTFWNPTLLYEEQTIDPYHIYLSKSQRNASPLRGKTIMVMGDSQQNDAVMSLGIARRLGVNVHHAPLGGHRIKYNNNTGLPPYNGWMYHWDARQRIFTVPMDYYFFMISSNDSSGGGDSSAEATQAVLDNYPVVGDDEATINNKMALFNALSESQKTAIFDYKQTYSAFIKQAVDRNPSAKVVLATIPISSYAATQYDESGNTIYKPGITAESQRTEKDWIFQSIRNDIYELANLLGANVCDLYNEGGITWENLPSKLNGEDSVHWTEEAKKEFIDPIIDTLLGVE